MFSRNFPRINSKTQFVKGLEQLYLFSQHKYIFQGSPMSTALMLAVHTFGRIHLNDSKIKPQP